MKAYLLTTGAVFALITGAHLLRIALEGAHLLKDPLFVALTLLAAWLVAWAARLFRSLR